MIGALLLPQGSSRPAASGRRTVVETQVAKVEGIDKRIVYNASKAYVMQLRGAEEFRRCAMSSPQ